MNLFKNFKTKRQLREEIKRLEFMLHRPQPINFVEHEVQKISSCMEIGSREIEVQMEVIKKQILHKMAEELAPFVEWDVEDGSDEKNYRKIIRADVYLAKRK